MCHQIIGDDTDLPELSDQKASYIAEAKRALKLWRKLEIDWRTEFPDVSFPPYPEPLDTVNDLMDLQMGKLYQKIMSSDPGGKLYGKIPLMASSSPFQIGALNAESYCERVLRCAGHVLTEGNTLLSDVKLEKLVILRMNKKYMQFMRNNYKHLIKDKLQQQFGMSIISPETQSSSAGPP